MRAIDGGVERVPLAVHVVSQRREYRGPSPRSGPSIDAVVYGLPRPEVARQLSPWGTCAVDPKYRSYDVAVISTAPPNRPQAVDHRSELRPLSVIQRSTRRHHNGRSSELDARQVISRVQALQRCGLGAPGKVWSIL